MNDCAVIAAILLAADRIRGSISEVEREVHRDSNWGWVYMTTEEAVEEAKQIIAASVPTYTVTPL